LTVFGFFTVVSNIIGEIEKHLPRELDQLALASGLSPEIISSLRSGHGLEARGGIGSTIGKGVASGAGDAAISQFIQGLFERELEARGLGKDILKNAGKGAASGLASQAFQGIESFFKRDMNLD
jgi:hypothetical protein